MSSSTSRTRRLALLSSVLVLFMSAPVAFSQKHGVAFNDACAQPGTCCPLDLEMCFVGGDVVFDAVRKDSGSCGPSSPGTGTCCEETGSYCNGGGSTTYLNFYFDSDGTC